MEINNNLRIFIGDDDPAMLRFGQVFLSSEGWNVQAFQDPDDLFNQFRADPRGVDLVWTDFDYKKEGTNGLILARKLKEASAPALLPIIMVSGSFNTPELANIDGVVDLKLPKPFSPSQLIIEIKSPRIQGLITGRRIYFEKHP